MHLKTLLPPCSPDCFIFCLDRDIIGFTSMSKEVLPEQVGAIFQLKSPLSWLRFELERKTNAVYFSPAA